MGKDTTHRNSSFLVENLPESGNGPRYCELQATLNDGYKKDIKELVE